MNNKLLNLLLILISFNSFSQEEIIANFNNKANFQFVSIYNDTLLLKNDNHITRIAIASKDTTTLSGTFYTSISTTNNGIYNFDGYNNQNRINYHRANNKITDLGNFNGANIYTASVIDNKLYLISSDNSYKITEYDGENNTSKIIFESAENITNFRKQQSKFIITTYDAGTTKFYSANVGQPDINFHQSNYRAIDFRNSNEDSVLFYHENVTPQGPNNGQLYSVWKINTKTLTVSKFIDTIKDYTLTDIIRKNNKYYLNGFSYKKEDGTGQIVKIPSKDTIQYDCSVFNPNKIFELLHQNIVSYHTLKYGIEFGYVNPNDTLQILKDLAVGQASSLVKQPELIEGLVSKKRVFHNYNDSIRYEILTNANDQHHYIYEIKNHQFNSLFKINNSDYISFIVRHDNYIYWLESKNSVSILKRRNINDLDPKQPLTSQVNNSNLEWYKETDLLGGECSYGKRLMNIETDRSKNSIIGFTLKGDCNSFNINDSVEFNTLKGLNVIMKYDSLGNFIWSKSFGMQLSNDYDFTNVNFKIASNGDVIILGNHFGNAKLDTFSLTSNINGYYLAIIDSKTGKFKKVNQFTENYYSWEFEIGNLTLDPLDNIYFTFTKKNGTTKPIVISGQTLELENYNDGLAKFSSQLNLSWLQNTKGHSTNSIRIAENKNELILTQSHLSIKIYDLSGNILNNIDPCYTTKPGYPTILKYCDFDINNNYFAIGTFFDTLFCENKVITSHRFGGKNKYETMLLSIDRTTQKIVSPIYKTEGKEFIPLSMRKSNNQFYVLGAFTDYYPYQHNIDGLEIISHDLNDTLVILKLDSIGNPIGLKYLNQLFDNDRNYTKEFMSVYNGYITVFGEDFQNDEEFKVANHFEKGSNLSILRLKDENWKQIPNLFKIANTKNILGDEPFTIYPNPFNDKLTIFYSDSNYNSFELTDLNGRVIEKGSLISNEKNTLNLIDLKQGIYILNIGGESEQKQFKIMK